MPPCHAGNSGMSYFKCNLVSVKDKGHGYEQH